MLGRDNSHVGPHNKHMAQHAQASAARECAGACPHLETQSQPLRAGVADEAGALVAVEVLLARGHLRFVRPKGSDDGDTRHALREVRVAAHSATATDRLWCDGGGVEGRG